MKPGYRTTATDLVRTLRKLRLDVLESAAAAARDERDHEPKRGKRPDKAASIREEERR